MTHSINLVREFHEKFNHPVADAPTLATEDLRVLRVKLIAEELAELCQALMVDLHLAVCCHDNGEHYEYVEAVDASAAGEPDLIEAADALGDLDYVVQGANLVFGFPAEAITREIHRSNMSKLGADGKPIYREDGKVLKGPSYSPPDIAGVMAAPKPPVDIVRDLASQMHTNFKINYNTFNKAKFKVEGTETGRFEVDHEAFDAFKADSAADSSTNSGEPCAECDGTGGFSYGSKEFPCLDCSGTGKHTADNSTNSGEPHHEN